MTLHRKIGKPCFMKCPMDSADKRRKPRLQKHLILSTLTDFDNCIYKTDPKRERRRKFRMANNTLLSVGSTIFMIGLIMLFFDGFTYGFFPPRGYSLPPLVAGFLYGSIFLVVVGSISIVVAVKID